MWATDIRITLLKESLASPMVSSRQNCTEVTLRYGDLTFVANTINYSVSKAPPVLFFLRHMLYIACELLLSGISKGLWQEPSCSCQELPDAASVCRGKTASPQRVRKTSACTDALAREIIWLLPPVCKLTQFLSLTTHPCQGACRLWKGWCCPAELTHLICKEYLEEILRELQLCSAEIGVTYLFLSMV